MESGKNTRSAFRDHTRLLFYWDDADREIPIHDQTGWEKRRRQILEGMQAAMGPLPDRRHLLPFDLQIHTTEETAKFQCQKISIVIETGYRLYAYLLLPKGLTKREKAAGILALHQTTPLAKDEPAGLGGNPNLHYAQELAARGYVVMVPDYPSFGDAASYDFEHDPYVSGTMKGIVNHLRCLDYLTTLPMVDAARLGVIGHSLGGHNAMFLGVFDPRLKVIVASCGWTPFHDYYAGHITGWTSPRYMPRLKTVYQLDPDQVPLDFYEVVAALAPRAFFSNSPLRDSNFAVDGVQKAMAEARTVYRLFQAESSLVVAYPDGEHDFLPEVREAAYQFMDRFLCNPSQR